MDVEIIEGFKAKAYDDLTRLSYKVYFKSREDAGKEQGQDESVVQECSFVKIDGKVFPISDKPIEFTKHKSVAV